MSDTGPEVGGVFGLGTLSASLTQITQADPGPPGQNQFGLTAGAFQVSGGIIGWSQGGNGLGTPNDYITLNYLTGMNALGFYGSALGRPRWESHPTTP